MIALSLLAASLTSKMPIPTATTPPSQAPTDAESAASLHTACLDLQDYNDRACGSSSSSTALCWGESLTTCECASTFCSGTPTRSLVARGSSIITAMSLLDEPAQIVVKSTSSDTSSHEASSKSTIISTTSSGISPPQTGTTTTKTSTSLHTESSTTSAKKPTSSTSASTSSSTEASSPATSSSLSSSGAVTTSPGSSIPPTETIHTSPSQAVPSSEAPTVVQTLYSTLVPTTPTYSAGVPTNAPTDGDTSTLSTGAKAGIGAGSGVGLLLVLTAVMLVLFKKRRARDESSSQYDAWPMGDVQQPPFTSTTQSQQQQHPNLPPRSIWHRHHRDVADNAHDDVGVGGSEVPVDMSGQDAGGGGGGGVTALSELPGSAPRSYPLGPRPLAHDPISTSFSSSSVAGNGRSRASQYQPYRDHRRYHSGESAWPARYHLHAAPSPSPSPTLSWRQQQQQRQQQQWQQHQGFLHPSYGAAARASPLIREEEEEQEQEQELRPSRSRNMPSGPSQFNCAVDGTRQDVGWGHH